MNKRNFDPIHPGEILLEDFLKPMEISQEQLAEDTNIPWQKISGIVQGKQDINADIALRLGQFFGMEAQFWMNLQVRYDLICTQTKLAEHLLKEVRPFSLKSPKTPLQSVSVSTSFSDRTLI